MDYGADYGSAGRRISPGYSARSSLSTIAAFPWVYAAMIRRSGDLAGLPLVVSRGRGPRGRGRRTVLEDHPLYGLLDCPTTRVSGRQWRRQMVIDYRLAGNHLSAVLGWDGPPELFSLVRLHPHRVKIEPDPEDGWGGYIYSGGGREITYPAEQILHLRMPSWEDDPRGLWGTGGIAALDADLTADQRARQRASDMAKQGRPDAILTPKADKDDPAEVIWDKEARQDIKRELDKLLEQGGSLVLSNEANLHLPAWSPRDLEFGKLREFVMQAILAVTGVPPHLVGLPVANYAQAEAQERAYWEMLIQEARDIEDAVYNPIARRWNKRLRVRHDFSEIDVLQKGMTARIERIATTVDKLGADPAEAAAYFGLPDLPVGKRPTPAPVIEPAKPALVEASADDIDVDTDTDDDSNGRVLTFADWLSEPGPPPSEDLEIDDETAA